jgi:hypothetical protein
MPLTDPSLLSRATRQKSEIRVHRLQNPVEGLTFFVSSIEALVPRRVAHSKPALSESKGPVLA